MYGYWSLRKKKRLGSPGILVLVVERELHVAIVHAPQAGVQFRADLVRPDQVDRLGVVAADHVEVEDGADLLGRNRRVLHEVVRAHQPSLLRRVPHEDDRSLRPLGDQRLRQRQHAHRPRRVVVGAGEHLALARRVVVVVRSDQHVLPAQLRVAARQPRHHVRRARRPRPEEHLDVGGAAWQRAWGYDPVLRGGLDERRHLRGRHAEEVRGGLVAQLDAVERQRIDRRHLRTGARRRSGIRHVHVEEAKPLGHVEVEPALRQARLALGRDHHDRAERPLVAEQPVPGRGRLAPRVDRSRRFRPLQHHHPLAPQVRHPVVPLRLPPGERGAGEDDRTRRRPVTRHPHARGERLREREPQLPARRDQADPRALRRDRRHLHRHVLQEGTVRQQRLEPQARRLDREVPRGEVQFDRRRTPPPELLRAEEPQPVLHVLHLDCAQASSLGEEQRGRQGEHDGGENQDTQAPKSHWGLLSCGFAYGARGLVTTRLSRSSPPTGTPACAGRRDGRAGPAPARPP